MGEGPKPKPRRLPYRELLARLKPFGIIENRGRGKGSERLFIRRDPDTGQERSYPIKCHGEGDEQGIGTIVACLRRFDISPEAFWIHGRPDEPPSSAAATERRFKAGDVISTVPCTTCWRPVQVIADAADGPPRTDGKPAHRYRAKCRECSRQFLFDDANWELTELA